MTDYYCMYGIYASVAGYKEIEDKFEHQAALLSQSRLWTVMRPSLGYKQM